MLVDRKILMKVSVIIPTFRDAARAIEAANAIRWQELPDGISVDIVIVDDGSSDGSAECLAGETKSGFDLLALPHNVGRSAARNAGARHRHADVLMFMDCDCRPVGQSFLAAHLDSLGEAIASTGAVRGHGGGFWDRYQCEASSRRATTHTGGGTYAGSSQNLAVRAADFHAVGGFDEAFQHYGFEDRDLLARLAARGSIAWTDNASIEHLDKLRLAQVTRKMAEAAQWSAPRFAARHPVAYRHLGYAAIDSRVHAWLRPFAAIAGVLVYRCAGMLDRVSAVEKTPYGLARLLVKGLTAAAYLHGSSLDATRSATSRKIRP
jgi:glycosyltransferase involved in cell wall biosynthesis